MSFHFEGLDHHTDVTGGSWIPPRLEPWSRQSGVTTVAQIAPSGYPRYARVFHPARLGGGGRLRWHEVALWSGRSAHPAMQFSDVARRGPQTPDGPAPWEAEYPEEGNLEEVTTLAECLRPFTSTPERCWFGLWEGYGFVTGSRAWLRSGSVQGALRRRLEWWRNEKRRRADQAAFERIPKLQCEQRAYLLYSGPLESVSAFHRGPWSQSPNLWWPDDRSWFVATEIDLDSTIVAGSPETIAAVMEHPELEALEVTTATRLDAGADEINRPGAR